MNSRVRLFPFGNKIIVVLVGVTLFQREVLETKAVGGASTVKVEAVVCTTLTARSEPYNRKRIHATNLNQGANARWTVTATSDVAARNYGSQR